MALLSEATQYMQNVNEGFICQPFMSRLLAYTFVPYRFFFTEFNRTNEEAYYYAIKQLSLWFGIMYIVVMVMQLLVNSLIYFDLYRIVVNPFQRKDSKIKQYKWIIFLSFITITAICT